MPDRLEHITAAERVEIASLLLATEGAYGVVSGLARELGWARRASSYTSCGRGRGQRWSERWPLVSWGGRRSMGGW
jgi:hypothetical protein